MVFDKWRHFFELRKVETDSNENTAIQREQDESEIIISWTQFGFSIFMLTTWVVGHLRISHFDHFEKVCSKNPDNFVAGVWKFRNDC